MKLILALVLQLSLCSSLVSVAHVHAHEKLENVFFSFHVPHAWNYAEYSNTAMSSLIGIGPPNQIILVPEEFKDRMLDSNEKDNAIYKNIYNAGAFSQFAQDADYNIKNAPLTTYVKYFANKYPYLSIISKHDSMVGKEKAVKIEGNDNSESVKLVIYLVLHDNAAYNLDYVANENDFDKYLPDFEKMIKGFQFND